MVYKCQKCECIFSVENFHPKKQIEYAVCAQCGNGRLDEEAENEEICKILDNSSEYVKLSEKYSDLFEKISVAISTSQQDNLRQVDSLKLKVEFVIFKIAYDKGFSDALRVKS